MRRILILALAALGAAFLMGDDSEATHGLGALDTPLCENSPCVLEVANHFGTYGTLNGDPRYQIILDVVLNDWSKSGVYLKLIPPNEVPRPDLATGKYCFDNGNPEDNWHVCAPGECYQSIPGEEGYNCFHNWCRGGDIAVCADASATSGGQDSGQFNAKIRCAIPQGNCDPLGDAVYPAYTDRVRRLLCHEIGHTLGLNHEGGGCMISSSERPSIHDVDSVAALHVGLGPGCGGAQYCYSSLTVTDSDEDDDGVLNVDEAACGDGSTWNRADRVPEKVNAVDDNVNTLVNEQLFAAVSSDFGTDLVTEPRIDNYDCDGDGYRGEYEQHIYQTGPANTAKDQDRCGNPEPLRPGYAYAQSGSWPSDLFRDDRITVQDITSFMAPVYHKETSPGDPGYDIRWDLSPGPGAFTKHINVQDMTALTAGSSGNPPMFQGQQAYNSGLICTD